MMQQEHIAEKIKNSYPFVNLVFGVNWAELIARTIASPSF
jgi:hypothetical protein